MLYEELLSQANNTDIIIKEKPLRANKGRIKGNKIAIKEDLTQTEKTCILSEELGHYFTSSGNILDLSITENRKQELRARWWSHQFLLSLDKIIDAFEYGCKNRFEIAEYLDVTEEFLQEAIEMYKSKYGEIIRYRNYTLYLNNGIEIIKTN